MLNPHLTDVEEVREVMDLGKIPQRLAVLRREDVLGRCKMVKNESDSVSVKDPLCADVVEGLDSQGSCNVIGKSQINLGVDQLSQEPPTSFPHGLPRFFQVIVIRDYFVMVTSPQVSAF